MAEALCTSKHAYSPYGEEDFMDVWIRPYVHTYCLYDVCGVSLGPFTVLIGKPWLSPLDTAMGYHDYVLRTRYCI